MHERNGHSVESHTLLTSVSWIHAWSVHLSMSSECRESPTFLTIDICLFGCAARFAYTVRRSWDPCWPCVLSRALTGDHADLLQHFYLTIQCILIFPCSSCCSTPLGPLILAFATASFVGLVLLYIVRKHCICCPTEDQVHSSVWWNLSYPLHFDMQDCFVNEDMVKCLLRNVAALLKPGGFFLGITPDSSTIW